MVNKGNSGRRRIWPSYLKAQMYCFFQWPKGIAARPGGTDPLLSWSKGGGLRPWWMLRWDLGPASEHAMLVSTAKMEVSVTQSCLIVCDPVDCSPPGSSVHGISFLGKNIGVGSHSLLQGICPTQGSNPDLLHYTQILYHLSHQASPASMICLCKRSAEPPDVSCLPISAC